MNIVADHQKESPYRSALTRELVAYNNQYSPLERWQCVGFYALDADGHVVGGIQGGFEWDWLHVTHLWVKDRGKGFGRALVKTAETFAQQHGKRGLFLDTLDFQAGPFYERLGFEVIGKIENAAGEHTRYFMSKRIGNAA